MAGHDGEYSSSCFRREWAPERTVLPIEKNIEIPKLSCFMCGSNPSSFKNGNWRTKEVIEYSKLTFLKQILRMKIWTSESIILLYL